MEHQMKRAVIVSGAPDPDLAFIRSFIQPSDFVITADAGLKVCRDAGIPVDLAVGDFDTYDPGSDAPERLIRLPAEKDWPDSHQACKDAAALGFQRVHILNAVGSRLDHSYANLLDLNYFLELGIQAAIETRHNCVFLTDKPVSIPKNHFHYLSMFAMFGPVTGLTLKGVKYPLQRYKLMPASVLCVSNEILAAQAEIHFQTGKLMILLTDD